MAWSWVRVETGTSPKLKQCMGGDQSARKAEECIRSIVTDNNGDFTDNNGHVGWVRFEPNGKAKVRFWWNTTDERRAIILDLEAFDVHDEDDDYLLSAEEMDRLRAERG